MNISSQDILTHVKRSLDIPKIVQAIARQKLIQTTAKHLGITINPAELQQAADQLRAQQELWGQKETMQWLNQHALTLDDFQAIAEFNLLTQKLAYQRFDKQIEPHFLAHQKDYTKVRLFELVLDDEDLALELFYALEEGEITFGELADQYAPDKEARYKGGYKGKLRCRELPGAIANAILAVEGDTLLKPIPIGRQFHLIYVAEKKIPKLGRRLRQEILFELFEAWVHQEIAPINLDLLSLNNH